MVSISIPVDERGGFIDALGAEGDLLFDELLALGRAGKLDELLFERFGLVGPTALFEDVLGGKQHPALAVGSFAVPHLFEGFDGILGQKTIFLAKRLGNRLRTVQALVSALLPQKQLFGKISDHLFDSHVC